MAAFRFRSWIFMSNPPASTFIAMGLPMCPTPIQPTFIVGLLLATLA